MQVGTRRGGMLSPISCCFQAHFVSGKVESLVICFDLGPLHMYVPCTGLKWQGSYITGDSWPGHFCRLASCQGHTEVVAIRPAFALGFALLSVSNALIDQHQEYLLFHT